ncbi:MAG TPA: ATP-binding protein [Candidatus Saccharimonadales bacterium]|nr:ATP-binding protein [Candidatus Saccharimonadales bacterium]
MPIRLISYLLSLTVMVILGVFVYASNTKGKVNRQFALFTLAADIWIIALAIADNTHSLALVNFGARLAFVSSALTVLMVVVFTLTMARPTKRNTKTILWFGIPAVGLLLSAPTQLAIMSVSVQSYGAGVNGGPAYSALSAYVGLCLIAAIIILIRGIRRVDPRTRAQLLYMLLGLTLTGIIAAGTNLVLVSYAFLGPPAYLILAGFTAYAVVKHRLFNIRAVVARSVAYILLLATLAGLYGAGIFAISRFILPTTATTTAQNIVYVVLAVVLAFTFQPLKRFFERITNRLFFRDHYETQAVLSELSNLLITKFTLDDILQASLKQLCERLHIASGQFYIFDNDKIYKVKHHGVIPDRLLVAASLQQLTKSLLVADALDNGTMKKIMDGHGVRVALRLHTHDQFVGFLILGDKQSGDIYSSQDIDLLQIATKEIAVAVANAKAYDEIAHFNLTLQEKVDDATKRLQAANRHLKELDKAKDEFISMASHQLRTPLTGIKSYLSMLLEGDAGKVNHQQQEFLDSAYKGSQRMINLVADLLNISRMSAGKFMIQKAPVDLSHLVEDETRQLQSRAADRDVHLTFSKPQRVLPSMELDEDKTRQVVMNFIDNAIYYAPHGTVKVLLDRDGSKVELRVVDNGIGVPKAAQSHLFKKFFRAGNAQSVRPDGTGLGLYLAKRVIEDQGGSIIFESAEGKGSTFGFAMPVRERKPHAARR